MKTVGVGVEPTRDVSLDSGISTLGYKSDCFASQPTYLVKMPGAARPGRCLRTDSLPAIC